MRSSLGSPHPGGRIWFAQGLRGLGAILVVADHVMLLYWTGPLFAAQLAHVDPPGQSFDLFYMPFVSWYVGTTGLSLGLPGLAAFFLISGFVIPMSLERMSSPRFLVARLFRIWPLWIAVMGLTLLALFGYAASHDRAFPYAGGHVASNLLLVRDHFGHFFINPVGWSLEAEVKFYLVCALLAGLVGLQRALPLLGMAGLIAGYTALYPDIAGALEGANTQLLWTLHALFTSGEFVIFMFIGICFYNHFRGHWEWPKLLAMISALLGLFFLAFSQGPFGAAAEIQMRSYALGLVAFAGCYALGPRLPYSRVLNFFADISFPLYLIHQIIGFILLTVLYALYPSPYLVTLIGLTIVVALAYGCHRLIEVPSNRLGKRLASITFSGPSGPRSWPRRARRLVRGSRPGRTEAPPRPVASAPVEAGHDRPLEDRAPG